MISVRASWLDTGRCYLCGHPLELPLAQTRCWMRDWHACEKRQQQLEADSWYAAEVERMRERAPA